MSKTSERQKITEDWLRSVGFKWSQVERQWSKHWLLWLGGAIREPDGKRKMFSGAEDLGIEIEGNYLFHDGQPLSDFNYGQPGCEPESWFCWFRADTAGMYHRFIHLRHILWQDEVIALVEVLTGCAWNPANHMYGQAVTPEIAEHWRDEEQRMDRRMLQHPWTEAYKDADRAKPLPEHVDAAIEGGKAK